MKQARKSIPNPVAEFVDAENVEAQESHLIFICAKGKIFMDYGSAPGSSLHRPDLLHKIFHVLGQEFWLLQRRKMAALYIPKLGQQQPKMTRSRLNAEIVGMGGQETYLVVLPMPDQIPLLLHPCFGNRSDFSWKPRVAYGLLARVFRIAMCDFRDSFVDLNRYNG